MSERACSTCGQELRAASPYRTAAPRQRDREGEAEKSRLVLEEEFREADYNVFGWAMSVALLSACTVGGATLLHAGYRLWLIPSLATAVGVVVCAAGCARCRKTIRAYRDQKRRALAERDR